MTDYVLCPAVAELDLPILKILRALVIYLVIHRIRKGSAPPG